LLLKVEPGLSLNGLSQGGVGAVRADDYARLLHFHPVASKGKPDHMVLDIDILTLVSKIQVHARDFGLIHQQLVELLSRYSIDGLPLFSIRHQHGITMLIMDSSSMHGDGQRLHLLPQANLIDSLPTSVTKCHVNGTTSTGIDAGSRIGS